jgi:hypothetical protein
MKVSDLIKQSLPKPQIEEEEQTEENEEPECET